MVPSSRPSSTSAMAPVLPSIPPWRVPGHPGVPAGVSGWPRHPASPRETAGAPSAARSRCRCSSCCCTSACSRSRCFLDMRPNLTAARRGGVGGAGGHACHTRVRVCTRAPAWLPATYITVAPGLSGPTRVPPRPLPPRFLRAHPRPLRFLPGTPRPPGASCSPQAATAPTGAQPGGNGA